MLTHQYAMFHLDPKKRLIRMYLYTVHFFYLYEWSFTYIAVINAPFQTPSLPCNCSFCIKNPDFLCYTLSAKKCRMIKTTKDSRYRHFTLFLTWLLQWILHLPGHFETFQFQLFPHRPIPCSTWLISQFFLNVNYEIFVSN